jgi:transposase-like protein
MEIPATLPEWIEQFPDEEACWVYLKRVRWPRGFACPQCGEGAACFLEARKRWQCRGCRRQVSVTAGTVFHGTRVPLRKWFLAIFFLARHTQGISALQLQRDLGLGSYQTAWTMLHKLRSGLHRRPDQLLRGDVEADETFVGGPRSGGKRGRGSPNKTMVAVLVERRKKHAGGAFLAAVPNASSEELGATVRGAVAGGETTLITDGFPTYGALASTGIEHQRHIQGAPKRAGEILPWVHTIIANLKSWLRGTFHGVSHRHLSKYLLEFTYRLNRRFIADRLFFFLTRRATEAPPLPYHQLIAEPIG